MRVYLQTEKCANWALTYSKKKSHLTNLDIAVGLAVRICGFTNKTRVQLPKWDIYKQNLN